MKNRIYLYAGGLAFLFAMALVLPLHDMINAQGGHFVGISSKGDPAKAITIDPKSITISKGAVVAWVNWAEDEVQIVFEEGKKCEDVTEGHTKFKLDADNCFVTSYVRLGETSSLRFTVEGSFEYEVRTAGGDKAKGEIVIK
jgi:plastocyanin